MKVDAERGHINIINVWPFFAINFDIHEVLIHVLCDFRILENQPLHHVAPVAAAVSDRQKNDFIFLLCFFECFRTPGIPVNRVVLMQQQIGAGLFGKTVRKHGFVFRLFGFGCFCFRIFTGRYVFWSPVGNEE